MIKKTELTVYFANTWIENDEHFIDGLSIEEVLSLAKEHVDYISKYINDNRAAYKP